MKKLKTIMTFYDEDCDKLIETVCKYVATLDDKGMYIRSDFLIGAQWDIYQNLHIEMLHDMKHIRLHMFWSR